MTFFTARGTIFARGIIMWDVLLDGLIDSLKIFPFLFLIYVLMELLERLDTKGRLKRALSGKFAPAVGAAALPSSLA